MYHVLSFAVVMMLGSAGTPIKAVADAQRKCIEAAKGSAPAPMIRLPVEKFDNCIAEEANKWPPKTREAICALGKSGAPSGSTVEVYMANGKCRTDYE